MLELISDLRDQLGLDSSVLRDASCVGDEAAAEPEAEAVEPVEEDGEDGEEEEDADADAVAAQRVWLRCLCMASYLLEHVRSDRGGQLQALLESVMLPAMIGQTDATVRNNALLAMGQCCMFEEATAKKCAPSTHPSTPSARAQLCLVVARRRCGGGAVPCPCPCV